MSEEDAFILSAGQAHEIELAMNRKENREWTPELVHLLSKGNMLGQVRDVLLGQASIVVTGKFTLLKDLGTITVPEGYDHKTQLSSFEKKNRKKFYFYNDALIDQNFPRPTRILKPGDKFHVRAWKQTVPGTTTSKERMDFLRKQKAVHTGAQGASLVFEEKRNELPKGFGYCSFDEKEQLWKDAGGYHRVPCLYAISDGDFYFYLGYFEIDWRGNRAFLCFCDAE